MYEHLSGGGLADDGGGADAELLAMGLAMRDAIVQDLARIEGVTVSCATSARAGSVPALPHVTPVRPERGESPFGFVRRQTQLHDRVWIVAPESGGLLACMRKMVGKERWIGCDSTAIRIASSKGATSEHFTRQGLFFDHGKSAVSWRSDAETGLRESWPFRDGNFVPGSLTIARTGPVLERTNDRTPRVGKRRILGAASFERNDFSPSARGANEQIR